jgi:hypothetical protein
LDFGAATKGRVKHSDSSDRNDTTTSSGKEAEQLIIYRIALPSRKTLGVVEVTIRRTPGTSLEIYDVDYFPSAFFPGFIVKS